MKPELFAPLIASGAAVGPVTPAAAAETGLSRRTVISAGGHDHIISTVAAQTDEPGVLLNSMGTAEAQHLINQTPVFDERFRTGGYQQGVLDLIFSGFFEPDHPELFRPLVQSLLDQDPYLLLADFQSYCERQDQVSEAFLDQERWTKMAILNIAKMGKFSSDRTIRQYAAEIWNTKPVPG